MYILSGTIYISLSILIFLVEFMLWYFHYVIFQLFFFGLLFLILGILSYWMAFKQDKKK